MIAEIEEPLSADGCVTPLVDYMWLVSTTVNSNCQPFFVTNLNTGQQGSGSIWEIIDGANSSFYQPDEITQNTYYVRCTRDISCCDFVETNLVAYLIDSDSSTGEELCPVEPVNELELVQNCDEDIIFATGDNMTGEEVEFKTNWTIEASNEISAESNIIFNAKDGTSLNPGFEIKSNSQIEIRLDGCNE